MSFWQRVPSNPSEQMQWYLFLPSTQIPLLPQGLDSHSSISLKKQRQPNHHLMMSNQFQPAWLQVQNVCFSTTMPCVMVKVIGIQSILVHTDTHCSLARCLIECVPQKFSLFNFVRRWAVRRNMITNCLWLFSLYMCRVSTVWVIEGSSCAGCRNKIFESWCHTSGGLLSNNG